MKAYDRGLKRKVYFEFFNLFGNGKGKVSLYILNVEKKTDLVYNGYKNKKKVFSKTLWKIFITFNPTEHHH